MTTSPNPNHAETAHALLDAVHDWQEREGETDATMLAAVLEAQTVATLALVEEQRTANLIAFGAAIAGWELELAYPGLDDQIAARLDLTQDVTP